MTKLRDTVYWMVAIAIYFLSAGLIGLALGFIDPALAESWIALGIIGITLVWSTGIAATWVMDRIWPERTPPQE